MRSFQTGKHGPSFYDVNPKPIISAYCANVRSILEYGCVIWGGAANTHLNRMERVQEKFLIWLCARCRIQNVGFGYRDLLTHFGLSSLEARRLQHDIMLLRNIHNNKIDSLSLVEAFPLAIAPRSLRTRVLFHVPYARVNTVKNSLFVRIPRVCNMFLNSVQTADVWHTGIVGFRKALVGYTTVVS